MQFPRLAIVFLASLSLAAAHSSPLVFVELDVLNQSISAIVQQATASLTQTIVEEVKQDMSLALEQAIKEVTDTVEQLLQPLLNETFSQPLAGKTPTNPATSCKDIEMDSPSAKPGYYWIQTSEIPLVQAYRRCRFLSTLHF